MTHPDRLGLPASRSHPTPPPVATWILRHTLANEDEREMVFGDLAEEFPRYGSMWYWRQTLSIVAHACARRASRRTEPASGDPLMMSVIKEVRYGWRSLFKRPLLTLTVAATLALGLGANAAIFNLIDRLVLRPYALENPDTRRPAF